LFDIIRFGLHGPVRSSGLPHDARLLTVTVEFPGDCITLWIESSEYELVPEGEPIPEVEVVFTREG
jgi:hypothetical protein